MKIPLKVQRRSKEPNVHAVALGRRGGKAGKGKAKARTSGQARQAVMVWWSKYRKQKAAGIIPHGVGRPERRLTTVPPKLHKDAVVLGRRGGKAGTGKAKARSSEQARHAAMIRWSKRKRDKALT